MKYQAILFDLDGTLLPMELEGFTRVYFGALARDLADFHIPQEALIGAIWGGTRAMMSNDGTRLNADVFWDAFTAATGVGREMIEPRCDRFYGEGFHAARMATQANPLAKEAVRIAREKAERVVLATNPIFPMQGQVTRMSWLGLTPDDFDLVTCYGTDRFCKPNPAYFVEVCKRIGVAPSSCLMIGNDEREDMACAASLGMDCYLVTDCRLPWAENPWQGARGSFAEMVEMLKSL